MGRKNVKGGKCRASIFGIEDVPYQLKIKDMTNVRAVMVTDYVIRDCEDFNWDVCTNGSEYCKSKDQKKWKKYF